MATPTIQTQRFSSGINTSADPSFDFSQFSGAGTLSSPYRMGTNTPTNGLPNYSNMLNSFNQSVTNDLSKPINQAQQYDPTTTSSYKHMQQINSAKAQQGQNLIQQQKQNWNQQQQVGQSTVQGIISQMTNLQNMMTPYNPQLSHLGPFEGSDAMQQRAQLDNQVGGYNAFVQQQLSPYQDQLRKLAEDQFTGYEASIPGNYRLPGGRWIKDSNDSPASQRQTQERNALNNPFQFQQLYSEPLSYYQGGLYG